MDHRTQLEVLVELANVGNMGRAAAALGVSQSTLSDTIARLESSYGAPLFERDRRGTRPTVYGEVVVAAATRALSLMDQAQREIGLMQGSASGRLVIGAEASLIESYLSPAIARGLRRYPKLRFRLHSIDSTSLVHEVREKRIDFFFGIRPDGSTMGLELREIGHMHVAPFVRMGHPLAEKRMHRLQELMNYPLIHGPGPRWLVRRVAEVLPRVTGGETQSHDAAVTVNDFGVVRALVRETDSVGLAPAALLENDFKQAAFVRLELPTRQASLLCLPMFIGKLENRNLPPAAQALIADLEGVVAANQNTSGG